jgi:hypothetical protein
MVPVSLCLDSANEREKRRERRMRQKDARRLSGTGASAVRQCGGTYAAHRLEAELGEGALDGGAGLSAREREKGDGLVTKNKLTILEL